MTEPVQLIPGAHARGCLHLHFPAQYLHVAAHSFLFALVSTSHAQVCKFAGKEQVSKFQSHMSAHAGYRAGAGGACGRACSQGHGGRLCAMSQTVLPRGRRSRNADAATFFMSVLLCCAGYHAGAAGVFASGPFPVFPAGAMPQGVVPGGAWPAASYGSVQEHTPACRCRVFLHYDSAWCCCTEEQNKTWPSRRA